MAIIINPIDGSLEFIGSKELGDALEEALKERVEYEIAQYMRTHSGLLNQLNYCKGQHYKSLTLKDLDNFIINLRMQKIKTN